jgi:hypothetical protein
MSWIAILPALAVLPGALLVGRRFDLRRLDDPVVMVFWFSTVLWVLGLGLGGLYRAAPQLEWPTVMLVSVSYAGLIAGSVAGFRARTRLSRPGEGQVALTALRPTTQGTRLLLLSLFAGYCLVAAFVALSGGVPVLEPDGEQARVDARAGLGYIVIAAVWLITLPTAALVASHTLHHSHLSRSLLAGLVVASMLALAALGNRAPVLVLGIAVAWIAVTREGGLPSWRLIFGGAVVAVALLAIGAVLRAGENMSLDLVASRALWITYVNVSNLQRLVDFIPREQDFLLGMGHVMDLAVLLPGPQPNFSTWLKQAMDLEFAGGGLTVGIVGEMYANWGPVAALLSMPALGMVLPLVRPRLRVENPLDRALVILLAVAVAGIVQSGVVSVLLYQIAPLGGLYLALSLAQSRLRSND